MAQGDRGFVAGEIDRLWQSGESTQSRALAIAIHIEDAFDVVLPEATLTDGTLHTRTGIDALLVRYGAR